MTSVDEDGSVARPLGIDRAALDAEVSMAKRQTLASKKVERAMHELKRGKLRSSSGQKVTSRKQAIAIGLSEAGRMGARVPKKPTGRSARARASSARKRTAA